MIHEDRVKRVLADTEADQLLLTDPICIDWLTGKMIIPMERFLGLLLSKDKAPVLYVNELFRFDEDLGIEKVYLKDSDDITEILRQYINPNGILGVDKNLPAKFLLPFIQENLAKRFINGSVAVDHQRSHKDEEEKELMRKASLLNDQAMAIFKTLVHDGVTEKQIADQINDIYVSIGAEGNSFTPIVAFGKNSADPHHMPDDTVVKEGDTVLFDVGCIYKGYCSDMTRTFFYQKAPVGEAEKIYNLVRSANEEAEKALKPGKELAEIDGIARGIITDAGYGSDFTHRLGHFIGREVHESGDVSSVNHNLTEVGNTFSIEPGIYNKAAGVRIEDLVLITEDGAEVLNHYPKDIEVIG